MVAPLWGGIGGWGTKEEVSRFDVVGGLGLVLVFPLSPDLQGGSAGGGAVKVASSLSPRYRSVTAPAVRRGVAAKSGERGKAWSGGQPVWCGRLVLARWWLGGVPLELAVVVEGDEHGAYLVSVDEHDLFDLALLERGEEPVQLAHRVADGGELLV